MEYKKEYRNIAFRVVFSVYAHIPKTISFAAQPYEILELLDNDMNSNPESYLVYGKVEPGEHLEVGFKAFSFEMTQDLHSRLGLLYEMIKKEYRSIILKKT